MTRRAISLMRSMLRVSRGWRGEGGDAEAAFIVTETRRVFRERRGLAAGSAEAEAALEEGENRLELARHYAIAYPRMAHSRWPAAGTWPRAPPPARRREKQTGPHTSARTCRASAAQPLRVSRR